MTLNYRSRNKKVFGKKIYFLNNYKINNNLK